MRRQAKPAARKILALLPPALLLSFLLPPAPLAGQSAADLRKALRKGDYEEALEGFKKIAEAPGGEEGKAKSEAVLARRGWAEALAATGKYAEALDVLGKEVPPREGAFLSALKGGILRRTGKLGEAREILSKALAGEGIPNAAKVECLVELGTVLNGAGRLEESRKAYEDAIEVYKEIDSDEAEALPAETFVHWALALIGLNRYSEANELMFQQAEEKDPKSPLLLMERGRAFLRKYNFPGSRDLLKEALGENPRYADALVVLADNYITDFQTGPGRFDEAEKSIQKALEVNPRSAEAYLVRGSLWLYDGSYGKAMEDFRRSIAEDGASLRARGLLAACLFLLGEKGEYGKEEAAARAQNPKGAEFYHTIAMALEQRFRYVDAVKMCDRALELDRDYWPVYMTLGINATRIGENARGREYLDKSWEKDQFNVWVLNLRKLNRYMDENHIVQEDDGFIFSFPRTDAEILSAFLAPFLKEARRSLEERYRMKIAGPIQVEDFSSHQMFSGRTVGLPGFAASGATFGKLVTLTTPKAIPQNWGVVAWHEFAHVAALQLTEHRVPRWFTEGLSVYEEGMARPCWARDFQRDLADAWASKRLLPLAEIDFGFTKPKHPRQILVSYFQGCMVVRLITERWGFGKILEILQGYRDGKGTDQIFREILGMALDAFDRDFEAYMEKWVEGNGYRPRLELDKGALLALEARAEAQAKDARILTDLAWAYLCAGNDVDASLTAAKALEADPRCGDAQAIIGLVSLGDRKTRQAAEAFGKALEAGTRFAATCHARLGAILAKEKDTRAKAIEHLEEAKRLSPIAVAGHPPQGNVYYQLAKLYEEEGDGDRANQQMMELARFQTEDPECRQRIVKYALQKKDPKMAVKYLEEIMYINPFDGQLHALLARAASEAGDLDLVIRENRILLGFPESNPRKIRMELARAYLLKGDKKEAAVEAKRVLEIDPDHEGAKEILEKATAP